MGEIMSTFPATVRIVEVGPREGLQNETRVLSVDDKREFLRLLAASGLRDIEAVGFVNPELLPQLADAHELAAQLPKISKIRYSAQVPSMEGLEHAIECGLPRISILVSASETFSSKTFDMSTAESIAALKPVIGRAIHEGISVRASLATCFVCPYEGPVAVDKVYEVAQSLLSLGVDELSIGDTIGAATPRDVEAVLTRLLAKIPAGTLAMNFHDTYGMAIANVYQSLQMGIGTFDSAAGGVGSCPFAPGASGNVATEDLLFLMQRLGIETGVSLNLLRRASRFIENVLDRSLPSHVLQTGTEQEPS